MTTRSVTTQSDPLRTASTAGVRRPSLRQVLRRTYLRLAFSAVSLAAILSSLVAWAVLRAYSDDNLSLVGRSLAYTVEAAVVFGDKQAAYEAISLIAGSEDVAEVRVSDKHGATFSLWERSGDGAFEGIARHIADRALPGPVSVAITHNGAVIGHIEVRGRGHQFAVFLLGTIGGIFASFVIILVAGTSIARHMHRNIVAPLRKLAGVAHAVRRERAFERRVPDTPIVELQELGDDFNALLDEFEDWQLSLREQNAALAHQANHDGLTGLPNRSHFEAHLIEAIAEARRSGSQVGVVYADSDRFKEINDGLGHDAGDAVLVAIASRLRATLRSNDLVARLGGDEFAALLPGLHGESDALQIAKAIEEAMRAPIALPGGREVTTSLSIGIALYPQHASDEAGLLRQADDAMYRAKRAEDRRWHLAEAPLPSSGATAKPSFDEV
ncbi:MAG TPA: diguanylate cyclase [Pararobbsia sp.]|nr:diguanylate cyclase [Pararobbsia sp.]